MTTAKKILGTAFGEEESKLYVDDVFSTYLYTGNGLTQTINNGIDLAGKGGMVWIKARSVANGHVLQDMLRGAGANTRLDSTSTNRQTSGGLVSAFNANGFTHNGMDTGETFASWTFRRAPKFFDVVTYTGNGVAGRQIPHELGIAPGMIIVKRTDASNSWMVYHRSLGAITAMWLELTNAAPASNSTWNSTEPSDSAFTVSSLAAVNANGGQYVAYLWAHDPSEDGIIQCGSFTTDASGNATVNLGWEPQFILTKGVSAGQPWRMLDVMRGFDQGATDAVLYANTSDAEFGQQMGNPIATGFLATHAANQTYIYLAIRRPNKPPTSGTEVYNAIARTGTGAAATVTGIGFAPDAVLTANRSGIGGVSYGWFSKLPGHSKMLGTYSSYGEQDSVTSCFTSSFGNDSVALGVDAGWGYVNAYGSNFITHFFRRALGFFDVVCYTGTGVDQNITHTLGTRPELIITKARNNTSDWSVWVTGPSSTGSTATSGLSLNFTNAAYYRGVIGNSISKTTTFNNGYVSDKGGLNPRTSGVTYVAYLFASLPGISKVGDYTGNGSSQTINCGFTTGARFILIKRTDATGDWYVWDTARGIVAANDPHLSLNTAAAEVTNNDSVDPDASGFIVNQNTATNINVSGGQYIFLAIA